MLAVNAAEVPVSRRWVDRAFGLACVSGRECLTAGTLSDVWTVDSQCDDGASMCLVT